MKRASQLATPVVNYFTSNINDFFFNFILRKHKSINNNIKFKIIQRLDKLHTFQIMLFQISCMFCNYVFTRGINSHRMQK